MEKTFTLAYGETKIPLTVRAGAVEVLDAAAPPPLTDLREAFRAAVEENAVGGKTLRAAVAPGDDVTVVVSDITRFWMRQDRICPLLLDYLHTVIGVPDEKIVFLVALGTHRKQTDEELRMLVGPEVYGRVRVVNHELHGPLIAVGVTSRGTQVQVNPLVVGRRVIVISGTVHHLMAGYGGGRKSIVPGVAGEATIRQNHRRALHPTQPRSSDAVGCGRVPGNPVHEDMEEAAAFVSPAFGISIVADAGGRAVALPSGDLDPAWAESCRLVDKINGVPIVKKADVVIASCGGFPKDINLYQSSKTMINAYQAVKDGGTLVFISECREGGGPAAFFDWSRFQREGTLDAELRKNFTIAGYIFYVCCEIAARTNLHMLTSIPAETLAPMRIAGHADATELQRLLNFGGKTVYVLPHGGNTVPMIRMKDSK